MKIKELSVLPFILIFTQSAIAKCDDSTLINMNLQSNVAVTKSEYDSEKIEFAYDKIYCLNELTREDLNTVVRIESEIESLKSTSLVYLKPIFCEYSNLPDQIQNQIRFDDLLATFSRSKRDNIENGELLAEMCS
ncbi:hypothetical protein [Photobacterium leiognathi]|uniref:hypothetical protein n=1 Tax=Photobacterium leiognathi TaxID=553611 RepID=UPI0027385AA8|nr:hypothetical protein [Photobacterium leiognathi]